jgi:mitotic spindle assembly checkpoint protein MAD2B
MAPDRQQTPSAATALPLSQAQALLSHFTTFLTTTTHTLLYLRNLYPATTFLTTRGPHNFPVHQSRHPHVCAWIASAVASIREQLLAGNADRVVFVVHSPKAADGEAVPRAGVVERWVFDVSSFPRFVGPDGEEKKMKMKTKAGVKGKGKERDVDDDEGPEDEDVEEESPINWVDVQEQFRGALSRVSSAAETLPPLPRGCTFTLAVELRDEAPAPVEVSVPPPQVVAGSSQETV